MPLSSDLRTLFLKSGGDSEAQLIADVTRLRDEVGFTPARDLDRGLADAVDWWMKQKA